MLQKITGNLGSIGRAFIRAIGGAVASTTATIIQWNTRAARNLLYGSLGAIGLAAQAETINAYELLDYACKWSHVSCKDVPLPNIAIGDLPSGYLGFYIKETNTVWVNIALLYEPSPIMFKETLVHELVHYLDYAVRENPLDTVKSICRSESNAWAVSNRWMADNGQAFLATPNWIEWYPQCRQYL